MKKKTKNKNNPKKTKQQKKKQQKIPKPKLSPFLHSDFVSRSLHILADKVQLCDSVQNASRSAKAPLSIKPLQCFWKVICASTCIKYSDTWRNLYKGPGAAALVLKVSGAFHIFIQNPTIFYTVSTRVIWKLFKIILGEDMMPYVAVLNARALS